jgi:hypothetical protein
VKALVRTISGWGVLRFIVTSSKDARRGDCRGQREPVRTLSVITGRIL